MPQKRRKRARARFNTKNTHEIPVRVIVVVVCDSPSQCHVDSGGGDDDNGANVKWIGTKVEKQKVFIS